MASGPITSWQIVGETMETVPDFIWGGFKITADGDCSHEIKIIASWKKSYNKRRQHIKKQRYYFANKDPYSQSYGLSSSHIRIWELNHKEGWAPKNWCFQTVVLEKTIENPSDSKEIKPVNPQEINPEYSWKNWCLSWSWNTLATWCGELTHWKKLWCLERLKAGREGGNRAWDGWVASLTQWTWV